MRLFYVPNEAGEARQIGFRRPLANLLEAGLLSDVGIFSLELRVTADPGNAEQHRRDMLTSIVAFKPDIILMQHLGRTGLTSSHFRVLRRAVNGRLIYHEADPYSRYLHPLPRSAKAAARASDVTYTVGAGGFAANFRRAGAKDVRWSPHCYDPDRMLSSTTGFPERGFDVVVVANRNRPRFRGLPDWRDRIAFVELLQERFGEKAAVYGNGWTGPSAKGPVPFADQHLAIRSGWVSANWDHYAGEARYFSNRLPISLAAGSVHATTRHPGYEEVFGPETREFLVFGETPTLLVAAIEDYLQRTTAQQRERSMTLGREYVQANYRQDDHLVRMLNTFHKNIDPCAATAAWDLARPALTDI